VFSSLNGGTVTNQATNASIIGGSDGIYVTGAAGTITNAGTIAASATNGMVFLSPPAAASSTRSSGTIDGPFDGT